VEGGVFGEDFVEVLGFGGGGEEFRGDGTRSNKLRIPAQNRLTNRPQQGKKPTNRRNNFSSRHPLKLYVILVFSDSDTYIDGGRIDVVDGVGVRCAA